MSEEELKERIRSVNELIVSERGFKYSSAEQLDGQLNTLFASFLHKKDYHTGFMLWGKSGCGKTTRLSALYLLMFFCLGPMAETQHSVRCESANDLVYPYATMELFDSLCNVDLLILDNLGYERGIEDNLQMAHSLISELLLKRYESTRPTIISSIFDIDNLGNIYGQRVADIIRESYYVMELTTNFRREIIKSRKGLNPQNYET